MILDIIKQIIACLSSIFMKNKMTEFRIYYESLEQANDYIKPFINEVISNEAIITLVKRPKNTKSLPAGVISAIQLLTTPDILVTAVQNDIETPLILIEFSEAVTTEDHELQRTYGAVASYLAQIYYIKISGNKQSEKVFGGAEYNPFSTPKILIDEVGYEGYIIADWETQVENQYTLLRNEKYPSCPPEIPILKDTIQQSVLAFLKFSQKWFSESIKELKKQTSYLTFREKVDMAANAQQLLLSWKGRGERNKNLNKLRFFINDEWIGAKINRFSHAMDPDRGILTFISFVFSKTRKIFGIYALVRPRGTDLLKGEITDLDSLKVKFKHALEKDKGGLPKWFVEELENVIKNIHTLNQEIDFQPIWEKHKDKISANKVVATIAYFLDGMFLNHNGVKLYWDRRKLLGDTNSEFLPLLKITHGFGLQSKSSNLIEEGEKVDEDEVTYTIVHKVLIPNNFRIVSISYPGSQGGGAILPTPELGKAQPREYPDIIALPPEGNKKIDVLLGESKGMFSKSELEKDTEKLLRYKKDNNSQRALKETLVVAKVVDKNSEIRNIVIGVAFGTLSNFQTTWQPSKVDFIFRVTGRTRWAIGIFNQELRDLIPIIEGETNFPKVYKTIA